MMSGGQRDVDEPDAPPGLIALEIGVVIIEKSEDGRNDDGHPFAIVPCPRFQVDAKRLLVDLVVIVVVARDLGEEGARPIVLEQVAQVAQRLHRLLVEHHVVDGALQAGDDVADGAGEVEQDGLDGAQPVELAALHEAQVVDNGLLQVAAQQVEPAHARLVPLVGLARLALQLLHRRLVGVRVVERVPRRQHVAHAADLGRVRAARLGRAAADALQPLLGRQPGQLEDARPPLVVHLGAVGEAAAHVAHQPQEAAVHQVLADALRVADRGGAQLALHVLGDVGTGGDVGVGAEDGHLGLADGDGVEHVGQDLLNLLGRVHLVADLDVLLLRLLRFLTLFRQLDHRRRRALGARLLGLLLGLRESQLVLFLQVLDLPAFVEVGAAQPPHRLGLLVVRPDARLQIVVRVLHAALVRVAPAPEGRDHELRDVGCDFAGVLGRFLHLGSDAFVGLYGCSGVSQRAIKVGGEGTERATHLPKTGPIVSLEAAIHAIGSGCDVAQFSPILLFGFGAHAGDGQDLLVLDDALLELPEQDAEAAGIVAGPE